MGGHLGHPRGPEDKQTTGIVLHDSKCHLAGSPADGFRVYKTLPPWMHRADTMISISVLLVNPGKFHIALTTRHVDVGTFMCVGFSWLPDGREVDT